MCVLVLIFMALNGIILSSVGPNPLVLADHPAVRQLYSAVFPYECRNWSSSSRRLVPHPNIDTASKRILNLVFHIDPRPVDQGGNIFEADWIELVLLGAIDRPLRILRWDGVFRNDSVHVIFGHPPDDLFFRMRRAGIRNFGSVQMADELMVENTSFYADCDFTFRFYWNAAHRGSPHNVHYVPLGVKSGFGAIPPRTHIPASRRRYLCGFVGSLRGSRAHALSQVWFRRADCVISADLGWADPAGLQTVEYRHLLRDTAFTLAPFGGNEESLRFYEALEAGSVPIAQASAAAWGDFIADGVGGAGAGADPSPPPPPIPRVAEWCQANEIMAYYAARPAELDALQASVGAWWAARRAAVQHTVRRVLDESFAQAHGAGA